MPVRIESQAEPIPGYRLIERLGGGGFGEVWKAEAPGGLLKAIKFVYGDLCTADDEEGVRAEQELKAMSRVKTVRHPYILSLERYDIIDGQLIIVMELADRNLWDRFRECRSQGLPGIPRDELLSYLTETSEALDLMNKEYQLQHLDIKPQNLFLVHNHIKVADFGLVKDLEGMVASVTGGVTPVYAAPETFDGWISRYCDQYSLAIVYQELLTAQRPFSGTNVRHLILQHLQGVPDLTPLPPGDREPIARALAKKPEDRFPSCQALVRALREAEGSKSAKMEAESSPDNAPAILPVDALTPEQPTPPIALSPLGPVTRWIRAHDGSQKPAPAAAGAGDSGDKGQGETATEPATLSASPRPRTAVADVGGDGVLFPALVIGLGNVGRNVLQRVATLLRERFGALETLPHLRLLYLDTDPEAVRLAVNGPNETCLRRRDVFIAPLHRPSYYLKHREGKTPIDTWLNPKMLYRIPRHATAAGMRALGRLAFVDNYRQITERLRGDLEECVNPEALAEAVRQTWLGLRMNRPRVYVITGLAGGTGSGMFLDLAYTIRALLRQMGYDRPEVVGVLLVPAAGRDAGHRPALGNAYAALTELNHFSSPGTVFSARYDSGDPQAAGGPIVDAEPPFSRCIVLPSSPGEGQSAAAPAEALALTSHFLVADLVTPLGRSADACRRDRQPALDLGPAGGPPPGLRCQTFGMHRVVWPRRALLREAAKRLCRRLVEIWMSKDGKPIQTQVKAWVHDQWDKQELGPDRLIAELHEAAEKSLTKTPETAFAELIEPVAQRVAAQDGADLTPEAVAEVLDQLESLIGKLSDSTKAVRPDQGASPSLLEQALATAAERLTRQLSQNMAELAVYYIEQPAFRLAGAEEAIRQLTGIIEPVLQHHERMGKELAEQAVTAFQGIRTLAKAFEPALAGKASGNRRSGRGGWWGGADKQPAGPQQLVELLRTYSKSRYQTLVLQRVNTVLVSLRGQLSDQMREVGFCRNRLNELARSFEVRPDSALGLPEESRRLARYLYPPGCTTLEEAAGHLLAGVTPAHLQELDQRMEGLLRKQFTALVQVCLGSANLLKGLQSAMQHEAETALAEWIGETSVVGMFLAQHAGADGDTAALTDAVADAFDKAAPDCQGLLGDARPGRSVAFGVLAAPPDPPEQPGVPRLSDLVTQAVADSPVAVAATQPERTVHEIVFYREEPNLRLADLSPLGPAGRESYRQMNNLEHFTPHTRLDITDWQPAAGE
jgi:serine/threonine protein kinase